MVERNRSQVASRYFHGNMLDERDMEEWDILRVDQLWMWIIDEKTIVTSSTLSFDGARDSVIESVLGLLGKRAEDPRLHTQASETDIRNLSRVIVQACCDFYDDAWRDSVKSMESVRHIFPNTINDIAIREADLSKAAGRDKDDKLKREEKSRQKRHTDMKNGISRTSKLFYGIRDTTDELKILLTPATHQEELQAKLCEAEGSDDCKGRQYRR